MQYLRRIIVVVLLAIAASGPALALSPSAFQVLFSGGWWLPGASVDMYFAQAKYYGCDISCVSVSRASTGYAQTASGTLVNFPANVPRITDQGFLIEEARTNILLHSQAFSNAYFAVSGATATDGATTAPDGTTTAAKLAETAGGTTHRIVSTSLTITNGAANVYAVYAKAAERTWIAIDYSDNVTDKLTYLNLSNCTIGTNNNTTATVSILANGWCRISVSSTAGSTTGFWAVFLASADNTNSYSGTAGNGAYIWQGDANTNTSFITSPIPTTTTSATRAADVPQLIGPAATAALAAKAIYAQTSGGEGISTAARLIDFNGTQSASFASTSTVAITNGTNTATATLGSASYSGIVKSAFGFDATSITARANGGTQATSANAFGAPSGAVYLGNLAAGTRALNGYMQRFALSPSKSIFDTLTAP